MWHPLTWTRQQKPGHRHQFHCRQPARRGWRDWRPSGARSGSPSTNFMWSPTPPEHWTWRGASSRKPPPSSMGCAESCCAITEVSATPAAQKSTTCSPNSPRSVPPERGFTVSGCARSSSANRLTWPPEYSGSGVPMQGVYSAYTPTVWCTCTGKTTTWSELHNSLRWWRQQEQRNAWSCKARRE